nr:MAG TPA: hypothetical protein [Caudoviricetes sp.]
MAICKYLQKFAIVEFLKNWEKREIALPHF